MADDRNSGLTLSGAALGTASYMAPEQIEKPATVYHRADIYSPEVVFYEMLTGELPLGRFAAPSEKVAVSEGVDAVVVRALEKERERRQQSAGVAVTFSNGRHTDWQARVVAVNMAGEDIPTTKESRINDQAEWRFPGLTLSSVKEFRFQVRRMEWIELRGIALAPAN